MRILILFPLTVLIGLAAAGHFHHGGDHGGAGKEVGYSVVTSHGAGGHGGKHGGGGGGHSKLHTSVSYGGHGGHSGNHGGYSGGHGGHLGGFGDHDDDGHGHHAYPKYEFDYGVKDSKTGDIKSQSEARDGDKVKGSYNLKEADGTTRHVEYSSDKKNGFTATVHKLGTPVADHGSKGGHGGHGGHGGYGDHSGHGGYDGGKASSYIVIKKQEGKKH